MPYLSLLPDHYTDEALPPKGMAENRKRAEFNPGLLVFRWLSVMDQPSAPLAELKRAALRHGLG